MSLKNLLFVDDEVYLRELAQKVLRKLSSNVDVAGDYASALKKIRKKKYDLIILDGLGGKCFRIYQDIKDISRDVVIFSGDREIEARAKELGIPTYDKVRGMPKIINDYKNK